MSEAMIAVDGGEVWASDSGDRAGDGPTLVLLHPGVGDSRFWDPFLAQLTDTHRVIRYDARGYGKSPAPTVKYNLYDDLLVVLDHFGMDRAAFVGCSQGGATSLAFAVLQPERVSALVLLAPGISGYPWADVPDDPDEAGLDAEFEAAGTDPAAMTEIVRKVWAKAGPTPEVDAQLRSAGRAWITNEGFEEDIPPVYDRLGEIAVPTSLLVGDLDRPSLIEADRQAAARIQNCEFVEVPGVDHLPALRVPELVLELIRRTVARS